MLVCERACVCMCVVLCCLTSLRFAAVVFFSGACTVLISGRNQFPQFLDMQRFSCSCRARLHVLRARARASGSTRRDLVKTIISVVITIMVDMCLARACVAYNCVSVACQQNARARATCTIHVKCCWPIRRAGLPWPRHNHMSCPALCCRCCGCVRANTFVCSALKLHCKRVRISFGDVATRHVAHYLVEHGQARIICSLVRD